MEFFATCYPQDYPEPESLLLAYIKGFKVAEVAVGDELQGARIIVYNADSWLSIGYDKSARGMPIEFVQKVLRGKRTDAAYPPLHRHNRHHLFRGNLRIHSKEASERGVRHSLAFHVFDRRRPQSLALF